MKKIIALLLITFCSFAQEAKKDTTYWKHHGFVGLNGSQTWLSDWAGGGQPNVAANGILNFQLDYNKGKHAMTNKVDAQYGIIKPGTDKLFKKNIDQIF